jgi:hypothetical protein
VCNFARNLARFVLSVENETIKDDVIVGHGLCGTSSEQHHAPHNHHFRVAELSLQLNSCCGVARPQANARATSWTMNGLGPAGHQQKSGELAASRLQTQDRDRGWRVVSKGSGDPRKQSRVSRWCVYLPLFLTNGSDQAGACVTAAGTCACIRVTLVEPQPTRHTHPAARESLHREIRRVSRIESESCPTYPWKNAATTAIKHCQKLSERRLRTTPQFPRRDGTERCRRDAHARHFSGVFGGGSAPTAGCP